MDDEKKRVLVCPLGWGLGHATRDIPIIESFLKKGDEVIVAGDEQPLALLSKRFEGIKTIHFPSFKVRFSKRKSQLFPIIWIAIRLPYHIIKEHFVLKRLVKGHKIDMVISDNRYGLWNKSVKTVFITHQLKVFFPQPFKFLEPVGERIIRYMAEKFDICWIPDFQGSANLAGELSHPKKLPSNAKYIGILSRFSGIEINHIDNNWELVGIVSGPSPQREMFIDEMAKLGHTHSLKTLIIKGDPEAGTTINKIDGIEFAGHLEDLRFASIVKSSKLVICRAGYSTIMDMVALGVNPIVVPTPGQTEQEYLLKYLSSNKIMFGMPQPSLAQLNIDKDYNKDLVAIQIAKQRTVFSF